MLEPVLANPTIALGQWIVAVGSDFKLTLLLTGLVVLTGGLWLVWHHRQQFGELQRRRKQSSPASKSPASESAASESPELQFERRKYQRRSTVGGMVASCGIVLAGFYWVHEQDAFAILLALLLVLIVGITILAVLDMVSIGIKHGIEQLADSESEADRAITAAIVKHQNSADSSIVSNDENP